MLKAAMYNFLQRCTPINLSNSKVPMLPDGKHKMAITNETPGKRASSKAAEKSNR